MFENFIKCCCVAAALFIVAPATANIWCSGKLAGVYINSSGDVIINGSWRNDWTRICNLNEATPGTVTCSLWASFATTAWQGNRSVRLMYGGQGSCSEIPSYNGAPTPAYVMLEGQS